MKKNNNKGFTLMEMLIVVAIIAILIAIAIPTFTNSLKKAKDASDEANGRALYAALTSDIMLGSMKESDLSTTSCGADGKISYRNTEYKFNTGCTVTITNNTDTKKPESVKVSVTLADEDAKPNPIVFGGEAAE